MAKIIELRATVDLTEPIRVVERFGLVIADSVKIELCANYMGIPVRCESLADLEGFVTDALMRHAKSRWATNEEALEAAQRMIEKHRPTLEALAAHDKPQADDAVARASSESATSDHSR